MLWSFDYFRIMNEFFGATYNGVQLLAMLEILSFLPSIEMIIFSCHYSNQVSLTSFHVFRAKL